MSSERGNSDNSTVRAASVPSRANWTGLLRLSLVAVPVSAWPSEIRREKSFRGCGRFPACPMSRRRPPSRVP